MAERVSTTRRLQQLPDTFRGTDLTVRFGWSSAAASQYLLRWKRAGLVAPFGGHSDVFANLLRRDTLDWRQATRLAYPSGVLVGLEVLRGAGWITQIPSQPTIALPPRTPRYATPHVTIATRTRRWFQQRHDTRAIREGAAGLPELTPAAALADLLATEGWGHCGITPDELYLDAKARRLLTEGGLLPA